MTAPRKPDHDEPLPAHTRKVNGGVIVLLGILALIGLAGPIVAAYYGQDSQNARQTANTAAAANQRNQRCSTLQGVRWRQASSKFQIAADDISEAQANGDLDKLIAARRDGRDARALLAAVNVDDERLKKGTLCPYKAGHPEATPDAPVNPTPATTEPR